MNRIVLSGQVAGNPKLFTTNAGVTHASFPLSVAHRTGKGIVKHVLFPIHCWQKTAVWIEANIVSGQQVYLEGYLSQSMQGNGFNGEITATLVLPVLTPNSSASSPLLNADNLLSEQPSPDTPAAN